MTISTKTTSKSEPRWYRTETKPLSVNDAWFGKKVKSTKYRAYESHLLRTLPKDLEFPEDHALLLRVRVFYSSAASDTDNCLKPFIDVLQKKYGFNDSRIFEIDIKKYLVPKGEEEILFTIEGIKENECVKKLGISLLHALKAKILTHSKE